jgi:hypothetical protein
VRRERRQLTRAELAKVTSRRPVVRRVWAPEEKPHSPGPTAPRLRSPKEGQRPCNTSQIVSLVGEIPTVLDQGGAEQERR